MFSLNSHYIHNCIHKDLVFSEYEFILKVAWVLVLLLLAELYILYTTISHVTNYQERYTNLRLPSVKVILLLD